MMEWLTAESILNRPNDPLQFCRDLLGVKIAERNGGDYRPDVVSDWLRNCYTEASALVDEHGIIHGKQIEAASESIPEQLEQMKRKTENMSKVLEASRSIAQLDPIESTTKIVSETCRILDCDRASIFTLDPINQELLLWAAEGNPNLSQFNPELSQFNPELSQFNPKL